MKCRGWSEHSSAMREGGVGWGEPITNSWFSIFLSTLIHSYEMWWEKGFPWPGVGCSRSWRPSAPHAGSPQWTAACAVAGSQAGLFWPTPGLELKGGVRLTQPETNHPNRYPTYFTLPACVHSLRSTHSLTHTHPKKREHPFLDSFKYPFRCWRKKCARISVSFEIGGTTKLKWE